MHQCTQSKFISIDRFAGERGPLLGSMQVKVELGEEASNWCAIIYGFLGVFAGFVGAVPGAEAAGAVSGFFGIISALC